LGNISFNYITQRPNQDGQKMPEENFFKVNLSVEKRFMDSKLSVMLWGRNIFADPYIEFYSPYVSGCYPHTVHRTFGLSVSYSIPN
jgi:hypothetical protein